jgi:hypothetical protein
MQLQLLQDISFKGTMPVEMQTDVEPHECSSNCSKILVLEAQCLLRRKWTLSRVNEYGQTCRTLTNKTNYCFEYKPYWESNLSAYQAAVFGKWHDQVRGNGSHRNQPVERHSNF